MSDDSKLPSFDELTADGGPLDTSKTMKVIEGDPNGLGSQLAEKAGDYVLEKTDSPILAAAATTAAQVAPMLVGPRGAGITAGVKEMPSAKELSVSKPMWQNEGISLKLQKQPSNKFEDHFKISAFDKNGKEIGQANYNHVKDQGLFVKDIEVNPEYRRKGIATSLHDIAEKHINKPITIEPDFQTPDASSFWKDRVTKKQYAEGGEVMFDQLPNDSAQASSLPMTQLEMPTPSVEPQVLGEQPGQMPTSFDDLVDDTEKYSTPGQQLGAGVEGLAKGVLGPVAPWLEKRVLKIPGSEQLARAEANPITHGIGEGVGLVGGALTGVGEGALMAKAGVRAAEIAGLGNATSITAKIGSEAVKQAAEMAIYQSSDEVGKLVLNDPSASAESAIANIGLASAFGAAGGALLGTVSPLWKATIGDKVEKSLGTLKEHLDGGLQVAMPENVEQSIAKLGLNVSPEMRSALSGNQKAAQMFNELREIQHPSITAQLTNLEKDVNNSVLRSIGRSTEDIANYSEAQGGKHAMDTFTKEYKNKFEPISKEFDEIAGPFREAPVSNVQIAALSQRIASEAAEKGYLGAEIPQNKIVEWLLNRLPSVKNAEDFSKVNTQLRNMTQGDFGLTQVRRDMQALINDAQFGSMAQAIGKEAPDLLGRYQMARSAYADLAKISESVGAELGLGKFVGPKTLLEKIVEKRSPEEFLRRLSPKGNAEILGFLGKHFPETLESIRDNELKQLLRPAVLGAKSDQALNYKILNNAIEKGMAGQPERIKFALPKEALDNIQAAKSVMDSIPGMKSSGTAGWQQKMMNHVPESALAAIALVTGHNPIFGAITGHLGKLLARDLPDTMKLAMLRFMSSDQPIKAEGFKSMVEFLANVAKGQTMLNKATGNVLKASGQVLTSSQMPSEADRKRLDEVVQKIQKSPEVLMRLSNSQVGHYLPAQQSALTESQTRAIQYLGSIRPTPFQASPLDRPIDPTKEQQARYDRALDIANQPVYVLQHVKDGTLQINDLKDLSAMYPALMKQMQQKVSNAMVSKHANEEPIPYKTKMGIGLFLGQAIDSTMTPEAIMSAQPMPQAPPQQPSAAKTNKIGKSNATYQTPAQSSEARRSKND